MITSLCPVLGQTHGQMYKGKCPGHLVTPYGRELKISFVGTKPYISFNPIGGSEFLVVKVLAEKFKFKPLFIPNDTFYGMDHMVRFLKG